MALIPVRKPQSVWNPERRMSSLLAWQVEHLHEAEMRLPDHLRTRMYVNAIQTEGEAAEYIRAVTEAIHSAHAEAEALRARRSSRRRKIVIEIAAVADEGRGRSSRKPGKKKRALKKRVSKKRKK